jgi:hypothetical protein
MDWAAGKPRGRRAACCRPPRARRVQDEGAFARAQGVEPERAPDEAEGVQLVGGGGGALAWARESFLVGGGFARGRLRVLDGVFPEKRSSLRYFLLSVKRFL